MKYLKKTFCLITFAVLFSMLGICAFASGDNYHDNCVNEHFDFIQDESFGKHDINGLYPSNTSSSCPYVAMSLLLSYYDAYWNDDFVPVDYETMGRFNENTGIIENEFHFTLENTDWWILATNQNLDFDTSEAQEAYSVFIQNPPDDFFQIYLISLGISQGFHDGELTYGLTDSEMVEFLEFYLYDICHFNSNQVTVHLMTENVVINTKEDLIDTARNLIENGNPVIYGGYNVEFGDEKNHDSINLSIGGHYLFGYDITEDENDIVLSQCWNGDDTTTFRTTDYEYISSIIWLEINEDAFPHVCSNSYESVISDEEYCVCEIYSEHPEHTHAYNTVTYSSYEHWNRCLCGEKDQIENHSLMYVTCDSAGNHLYVCECGYREFGSHSFTYSKISNSLHRTTCACGYTYTESHVFRATNNPRYYSCKCGYLHDSWGPGGHITMGAKEDEETE